MDPTLISQPGGIIGWVSQYGQIVFFFVQIAYWAGILLLLGYAVAQFKRWVNYQLGTGHSGALRTGERPAATDAAATIAVEEFVE